MSNHELHAVIKELKEYKLLKEEAEARISELENLVKAEMKSQNTEKMSMGEYKCSLATVTTTALTARHFRRTDLRFTAFSSRYLHLSV